MISRPLWSSQSHSLASEFLSLLRPKDPPAPPLLPPHSPSQSTLLCLSQQHPVPQPHGISSAHLGHYCCLSPWCPPDLLLSIRHLLTYQLSAQSAPLCWKVFVLHSLYLPILATQSQPVSFPAPVSISHHLWLCTVTPLRMGFFDPGNSFSSGAPSLLSLYLQHSARSLAHRRFFLSVYCLGGWMEGA